MQNYAVLHKKAMAIGNILDAAEKSSKAMQDMLSDLFTDKKSLYIESVELIGQSFHVEYCHEYTLNNAEPDWQNIIISKSSLISYIIAGKLSENEFLFLGFDGIESQVTELNVDGAETLLLEILPEDRNYIIRCFIEKGGLSC